MISLELAIEIVPAFRIGLIRSLEPEDLTRLRFALGGKPLLSSREIFEFSSAVTILGLNLDWIHEANSLGYTITLFSKALRKVNRLLYTSDGNQQPFFPIVLVLCTADSKPTEDHVQRLFNPKKILRGWNDGWAQINGRLDEGQFSTRKLFVRVRTPRLRYCLELWEPLVHKTVLGVEWYDGPEVTFSPEGEPHRARIRMGMPGHVTWPLPSFFMRINLKDKPDDRPRIQQCVLQDH